MALIHLLFDRRQRMFLLRAWVALPEPWGHAPASFGRWLALVMTFDTGAYNSAIADSVAGSLGVPVDALPLGPTVGATGHGFRPVLGGLFFQPRAPGIQPVLLPKVTILPASLEAPAPPQAPPSFIGPAPAAPPLNLLGMDFVEQVGASVSLNVRAGRGQLQWR